MRNGTFSFCCLIEWGCLTGPWGVGSPLACFELRNIYLTQMDISRPGEDLESIFLHILLAYFVETQSTGFSHNFTTVLLCTMGWIPDQKRPLRELAPVRDLLPGVWGLNPTALSYRLKAYGEHWKESMSLIDDAELTLNFHGNVTELIAIVRENSQGSVENVETAIAGANLRALEHDPDPISITAALRFSMRLWLFTEPELSDKSLTLRQLVEQKLPKTATSTDLAILHTLSDDFSAKSITRKGGFRLVWTSYLSEHLTFEGTSSLRVFRHASALRQYASLKSRER